MADLNRGMSANGSTPRRTCILPYSAQRASVGITLPGLSRPFASNAAFSRSICSRSSGLNCTHIEFSFSIPTPCSPVTVPPNCTLVSRMSAPNSSAAVQLVGVVGVEQDQRMQVAVAGVEHVAAAQPVLASPSPAMAIRMSARRLRGMVESMHM